MRKQTDTPVYSFTYIDKILDFVTKLHLNPWIQLSYMPEKLAKYPNKRLFGSNVSQPHSIAAWCRLVSEFLQHISNRYGLEVIRSWKIRSLEPAQHKHGSFRIFKRKRLLSVL